MAAPVSRLGRQIAEVTTALRGINAQFALIGGLALAAHNVVRATQDVDLLVDADRAILAAFETGKTYERYSRRIGMP